MKNNYTNKYWAYELLAAGDGAEFGGVEGAMSSSAIDLNPHQIQAAMFALNSPLSRGAILADEVGLGKTIEAGLVLSEYYLRGKQKLIIVCPASLRKQWERELEEKFDIPTRILDRIQYDYFQGQDKDPLDFAGCIICSYNFAAERKREMRDAEFDLVVIDEAHKLRNLYKGETFIADNLYEAFLNTKKLLLTATPIQNSLMDIFSLVSFIDPTVFGNKFSFEDNYLRTEQRHRDLQQRLKSVLHRTLRRDVLEYIRYTNREAITIAFDPTPEEQELYNLISEYMERPSYGMPSRFRKLIVLMIRKLMASSTNAVKGTLEGIRDRLIGLQKKVKRAYNIVNLIADDDLLDAYREEFNEEPDFVENFSPLDVEGIAAEIEFLEDMIKRADKIKVDDKTDKMIVGIEQGFAKIKENGGVRKAIIFTESQRTLDYLFKYLSANGFRNKIVTFSGSNNSALCGKIYEEYKEKNPLSLSGVRSADMRAALIDKFKNDAEIMIATEAGAEGLNLQFCSMLVNYDLPWNPQRVEQRIGRIHRYGQKHDVVIVNFINKTNAADVRLYDILQQKFKLFDGVFGASDEILGALEDGLDFERAVGEIFQSCRTPEEIEAAFDELQERLGVQKEKTLDTARQLVLENLNPTIAEKLRVIKVSTDKYLERRKKILWDLTRDILGQEDGYFFNDATKTFGAIKEHVFGLDDGGRYAYNSAYKLDFTRKDTEREKIMRQIMIKGERRNEKLKPRPYNPTTPIANTVIQRAIQLPTDAVHLVSKIDGMEPCNGVLRISVYKRNTPTEAYIPVVTFIDNGGSELKIDAGAFFDGVINTGELQKSNFHNFLDMFHDKKVKSIASKDKRNTEDQLRGEIEKLRRWAYEEKNSLKYQIKSLESKVLNLRKKFKAEKNLEEKVKIGMEMDDIKNKIADLQLNTFEKQSATDKKAEDMILGRKRAMKHTAEVFEVMLCSWEII